MANPQIPNGIIPQISPGGFSHGAPGGAIRTEVDGGFNRYALDFDRGVQSFNVTLLLSRIQYSVWTAFFINIVKKGTITFDMKLDSGFGVAFHPVNIIPGSYNATAAANHWVVSFQVESEAQAYGLDEEGSQGLVDIYNEYGEDTPALLNQLEQFANFDSDVLDF